MVFEEKRIVEENVSLTSKIDLLDKRFPVVSFENPKNRSQKIEEKEGLKKIK